MAKQHVRIAEFLLNDFYGPLVSSVAHELLGNYSLTLPQLKRRLPQIPLAKLKECLMCLLQNGLASSKSSGEDDIRIKFRMPVDNVFTLLHCASFIYRANLLFGEVGRELAHEFTLHGQLEAEEAITIVMERLAKPKDEVKKSLEDMFRSKFIKTSSLFEQHLQAKDGGNNKVEAILMQYNGTLTEGILYSLNCERFYEQERNELIVSLVSSLNNHHYVKNVMLAVMKLCQKEPNSSSKSLKEAEILNTVEKDFRIPRSETLGCLKTLVFVPQNTQYRPVDDILVLKKDPFQANCYKVDWMVAIKLWLRRSALRYAAERHGSHAACILGMLLSEGSNEMDTIQKKSLICPKEAKCIVYALENDGFVERLECITTGDPHRQEPRYRTAYLHLARLLEARWEQAIANVLFQRKEISDSDKVLLNKYKMLDKFARTLEDDDERKDLWASLTRPERQTLAMVRQKMLQTGVQQQTLSQELIMIKHAVKVFLSEKNP